MRSTRDFLLGFLTGVAAGMLTSPKSGRENRQYLKDEADRRTKDLQDQWNKGYEQVKAQVDQVKTQVNQQVNQWKNKVQSESKTEDTKDKFNNQVDEMADNAHEGIDSTRQSFKVD